MYGNSNSPILRKVVPIRSFEDARYKYEKTKPIRGRGDDTVRPLSDRRAVDSYNIRKVVDVANNVRYECWMYRTPVITYNENGTIVFDMGGWPSPSTRTFISEVAGFTCGCKDGISYICLPSGKVVMPKSGPTVIRQNAEGVWELAMGMRVFETQLQRKEANAVRAKYKEFIDYVNNMLKLRGEVVPMYGPNAHILRIDYAEFEDALADVPAWEETRRNNEALFKFIAHGTVHNSAESFYKAFLLLIATVHNVKGFGAHATKFNMRSDTIREKLKELIYKHHSNEVFKRVELPVGKLPSKRYEGWV